MVKKIVLVLFISILLGVISIVSLILFIDPNHFRDFIAKTVKEKTGYELTINGDLRWYVWPHVSILTGAVLLEDEGAQKPILSADNMRLDVDLLPLFARKLVVNTVFMKSAVINVTDDSKGKMYYQGYQSKPMWQVKRATAPQAKKVNWAYSVKKLEINDSTLVLQTAEKKRLNFRDMHVVADRKDENKIAIDLSGKVNRDQRDVSYKMNATVDIDRFPNRVLFHLNKFIYDIKGVGLPNPGLSGEITGTIDYHDDPFTVKTSNLVLTLANSEIKGKLCYTIKNNKPNIDLQLFSEQLDLASYITPPDAEDPPAQRLSPVFSSSAQDNALVFLNNFNANVEVKIDKLTKDQLQATNVIVNLVNQNGIATINRASFHVASGDVFVTGRANGTLPKAAIQLKAQASNIQLADLFAQLAVTDDVSGVFNGQGTFSTDTLDKQRFLSALKGDVNLSIEHARLNNLNMLQIIQTAVAQFIRNAFPMEQQQKYTEFHKLSGRGRIDDGQLKLTALLATSEMLSAKGMGNINLLKKDLDVNLNVNILGGWNEKSETIAKLQKMPIPFRIYGQFAQLNYQVGLNKVLREQLQEGLNKLKNKYLPDRHPSNDRKDISDKLNEWLKRI